jgi:hypothetical protein
MLCCKRLDSTSTVLGASISLTGNYQLQLSLLLGVGQRNGATKTIGFAPKITSEKALKLAIYTTQVPTANIKNEMRDINILAAAMPKTTFTSSYTEEEGNEDDVQLTSLKLPSLTDTPFKTSMIEVVSQTNLQIASVTHEVTSNAPNETSLHERMLNLETRLASFMVSITDRLDRMEQKQDQILEALVHLKS